MRQSFWKKVLAAWLSFLLIFMASLVPGLDGTAAEGAVTVSAPSAILLEAQTGTVIFEKDADRICSPASITKIMTLLLIFEALRHGQIHLTDEVVTSEHAQSMGGSQVFLEAGEVQTVETLIKCIAVASGNDAAVAMAEYICGSEEAFVTKMNEKAQSLGMTNTHFTDCRGLTDDDSHHTTARDVAIMSRELVQKYPDIYQYTGIWMEDITHTTARGSTPSRPIANRIRATEACEVRADPMLPAMKPAMNRVDSHCWPREATTSMLAVSADVNRFDG